MALKLAAFSTIGGRRLPERTSPFLPKCSVRRFIHTKDFFGPPGASDLGGVVFFFQVPTTWMDVLMVIFFDGFFAMLNHHF